MFFSCLGNEIKKRTIVSLMAVFVFLAFRHVLYNTHTFQISRHQVVFINLLKIQNRTVVYNERSDPELGLQIVKMVEASWIVSLKLVKSQSPTFFLGGGGCWIVILSPKLVKSQSPIFSGGGKGVDLILNFYAIRRNSPPTQYGPPSGDHN